RGRREGRGRRGDELLPAASRRAGAGRRDAGPRRDRPGLPGTWDLPSARARERAGRGRGRLADHAHVPERGLAPGLRRTARLAGPAGQARLGAAAAAGRSASLLPREGLASRWAAPAGLEAADGRRLPDRAARRVRPGGGRALAGGRARVRQPSRPRRRLSQLALRRRPPRVPRLRRVRGQAPGRDRDRRLRLPARRRRRLPRRPDRAARRPPRDEGPPASLARRGARRRRRVDRAPAAVARLRALAVRVDEVVVLADAAVPDALPSNCRVHLFRSSSKVGRGLRFEAALARELGRRPRPAAVVAHMCPIYAVLAAPLARPLGVPVLLWYAHWKATPTLRLAARVSSRLVSVD